MKRSAESLLRSRIAAKVFAVVCWLTLAVEVLVALAIRLDDRLPAATLISYGPRWIWLTAPVILAVGALRRRFLLLLLTAAAAICLFGIMQLNPRVGLPADTESADLNVLTLNAENVIAPDLVASLVRNARADVVLMQEARNETALRALQGWSSRCAGGLCTGSRWPIATFERIERTVDGGTAMATAAELTTPRGPLNAFNVHLETVRDGVEAAMSNPISGSEALALNLRKRDAESAMVTTWIRARAKHPAVIGGDFNMPTDSALYRFYWSGWQNTFRKGGVGFGYTKHTRWWGIRIDHILASPDWEVMGAAVGGAMGSDHRPVTASLRYRASTPPGE